MGVPVINFATVLFITYEFGCASWQAAPSGAQLGVGALGMQVNARGMTLIFAALLVMFTSVSLMPKLVSVPT